MGALVAVTALGFQPLPASAASYTHAPELLVMGTTYNCTIHTTADKYCYNVKLKKAGRLDVSLKLAYPTDVNMPYIYLRIFDGNGAQIKGKLFEGKANSYSIKLAAGSYQVIVDGFMGQTSGADVWALKCSFGTFATPSVSKAKSTGKKKVKVSWTKKSNVDGYTLKLATNKKFSKNVKTVKVNGAKSASATVKKLKSGKKYYVKVRTNVRVYTAAKATKTVHSSWSKTKTVRVK